MGMGMGRKGSGGGLTNGEEWMLLHSHTRSISEHGVGAGLERLYVCMYSCFSIYAPGVMLSLS